MELEVYASIRMDKIAGDMDRFKEWATAHPTQDDIYAVNMENGDFVIMAVRPTDSPTLRLVRDFTSDELPATRVTDLSTVLDEMIRHLITNQLAGSRTEAIHLIAEGSNLDEDHMRYYLLGQDEEQLYLPGEEYYRKLIAFIRQTNLPEEFAQRLQGVIQ